MIRPTLWNVDPLLEILRLLVPVQVIAKSSLPVELGWWVTIHESRDIFSLWCLIVERACSGLTYFCQRCYEETAV